MAGMKPFSFPVSVSWVVHAVALVGQAANLLAPMIPTEAKPIIAAGLALIQGIVGLAGHYAVAANS